MNRYELAIATADWLEQNPRQYDFYVGRVPPESEPGAKRCLIGQMGFMSRMFDMNVRQVAPHLLQMDDLAFYNKMSREVASMNWMESGKLAAIALRGIARKQLTTPATRIESGVDLNWFRQYQNKIHRHNFVRNAYYLVRGHVAAELAHRG